MGEFNFNQGYTEDFSFGYGYESRPVAAPAPPQAADNFGYAPDAGYAPDDGAQAFDGGAMGGYGQEVSALVDASGLPTLGAILVERGVLDPEAAHQLVARQYETGGTFAQVALDGGLVAPDQLVEALQMRQAYG